MTKHRATIVLAFLVTTSSLVAQPRPRDATKFPSIDPTLLLQHVKVLSSDE